MARQIELKLVPGDIPKDVKIPDPETVVGILKDGGLTDDQVKWFMIRLQGGVSREFNYKEQISAIVKNMSTGPDGSFVPLTVTDIEHVRAIMDLFKDKKPGDKVVFEDEDTWKFLVNKLRKAPFSEYSDSLQEFLSYVFGIKKQTFDQITKENKKK